ncbi:MAG: MFS transporter [Alphaproteobacteria bacterium]
MFKTPATLALTFSCVGHFLFHYFAAMYFTIVIALDRAWPTSYENLIELWTPAAILIGLAALPAGRLGDVWSAPGMLIIMFFGMGAATAACGFADTEWMLLGFLACIGLFGAIYHPVGISWLVRSSGGATGKKLAINGVAGGLGAAAAGGITGLFLEIADWRAAFIVPGVICVLCGFAMLYCLRAGLIEGETGENAKRKTAGKGNMRAFALLLLPMFAIGLIYNTTQAAMPKLFEEGLVDMLGGNLALVGLLVAAVYVAGAVMQFLGGHLADRYPLKFVYLVCWLGMIPMLFLMAMTGNVLLFAVSALMVVLNTSALPSENMLLSRFAPSNHQGLAFGIKFVLAFGAAPLGVLLISWTREATGSFSPLLTGMAILATVTILAILLLPGDAPPDTVEAPAE